MDPFSGSEDPGDGILERYEGWPNIDQVRSGAKLTLGIPIELDLYGEGSPINEKPPASSVELC